jgi:hypothetical protein
MPKSPFVEIPEAEQAQLLAALRRMRYSYMNSGQDAGQHLTDMSSRRAAGPCHPSRATATIRARSTSGTSRGHHGHRGGYEAPRALSGVTPCKSSKRSVHLGRLLTCSWGNTPAEELKDILSIQTSMSFGPERWPLSGTSTTARRIPTSRPASGSGACSGSSHRRTRNVSCPRMGPLPNTSARGATASPPRPIDKRWSNASRAGKKSQGSRQRRQRYRRGFSTFLADEHINMQ